MIRIDKYLCDCGIGSRQQVKEFIKKGMVQINDQVIKRPEQKLKETVDRVTFMGQRLNYQPFHYYMLYKPMGVVTATRDSRDKTVLDLLDCPEKNKLFPVGRLDKDTEGLLLLTDDGACAHSLLSPKKKVPKTYYVETAKELTFDMEKQLSNGVDIGEKQLTSPARVEVLSETSLYLTITEGKFHQVKRMMKAVGNEVTYLKRISMGALLLDSTLSKGQYRSLTREEILSLKD